MNPLPTDVCTIRHSTQISTRPRASGSTPSRWTTHSRARVKCRSHVLRQRSQHSDQYRRRGDTKKKKTFLRNFSNTRSDLDRQWQREWDSGWGSLHWWKTQGKFKQAQVTQNFLLFVKSFDDNLIFCIGVVSWSYFPLFLEWHHFILLIQGNLPRVIQVFFLIYKNIMLVFLSLISIFLFMVNVVKLSVLAIIN